MTENFLTVSDLCERWRVDRDLVYSLITSAKLEAVNIGTKRKACWRIPRRAVETFEATRSNAKPKPIRRKRRKRLPDVPKVVRD